MPNPNLINDQWQSFSDHLSLQDCSEVQQKEMRHAFFGGALSLFNVMAGGVSSTEDPSEVTEPDLALMNYLKEELDQYAEDLEKVH